MEPLIKRDLKEFNELEAYTPYLIKNRKKLTNSPKEKQFLIFEENKYIAFIVPDVNLINGLQKDKIRYSTYLSGDKNENLIYAKKAASRKYRKSVFNKNLGLSTDGSENLLLRGSAYGTFTQTLIYFYWNSYLHGDFDIYGELKKEVRNPYVETGNIEKWIEYDYVQNDSLLKALKKAGFKDLKRKRNNPNGLKITFKPNRHVRMIFPAKTVTYQRGPEIWGESWKNGAKSKLGYFDCTPIEKNTAYGYVQYAQHYDEADLLPNIKKMDSDYKMLGSGFDLYDKAYNVSMTTGKTWIHKHENIKFVLDGIPSMMAKLECEKQYHGNGVLNVKHCYLGGKKSGTWEYYDETGKLTKQEIYKSNILWETITEFDKPIYAEGAAEAKAKFEVEIAQNIYLQEAGSDITEEKRDELIKKWNNFYDLNTDAWNIYLNSNDPDEIQRGIQLVKRSIELKQIYENTDTYAALLFKQGKYKEANSEAEKAIKIGKTESKKVEETKALLKKIEAALKRFE